MKQHEDAEALTLKEALARSVAEALTRAVDLADGLCTRLEAAGEDVTEERRALAELAAVEMMEHTREV